MREFEISIVDKKFLENLSLVGNIRAAKSSDAAAIRQIYAPYIENSAYTFETVVPSDLEFERRIKEFSKFGFYVFEVEGKVVSYAYASQHRERKAYQWCCECSVYTASDFQRKGIGRALYLNLFEQLKSKGFVNVYAGITLPNSPSLGFHETLGFEKIGIYPSIGYKLGAWHDVQWWYLKLNDYAENPPDPTF